MAYSNSEISFSTLESTKVKLENVTYTTKKKVHFIEEPESYYLGAKYVVIEVHDDMLWYEKLKKEITIFVVIAFLFMTFFGYFLLQILYFLVGYYNYL